MVVFFTRMRPPVCGLRVAGGALDGLEGAEAGDLDAFAGDDGAHHRVEDGVDGVLRRGPTAELACDCFDEPALVHDAGSLTGI
ncbi:hypothetical protein GCM10023235_76590 [Kitasatospora terrestris]|uniref:Uncharacterized protein n=1 Tax=Kitasatospora terrestris TaxID=258051 RepID=A0ABP9EVP6_9ACTN